MAGVAIAGTTLPPTPDYMATLTNDHFYVKYNPHGSVPMTKTLDESLAAYEKVDFFFLGFHNKTTLEVAENYNEYRLITGIGDLPETANACDFNEGPRGIVAIKSPDILPNYRQVLTYHLARIMERTIMQDYHNPPEWFQDGLAAYVASDITEAQRKQAETDARGDRWKNLDQLEAVYSNMTVYNEKTNSSVAARGQSFLLIEYVGNTYGNRTLVNILADFGYTGNITWAFLNNTGQTPDKFNQDLKSTLIAPMTSTAPTSQPIVKEYISGYVRNDDGTPLSDLRVTFSGTATNTTVTTDKAGYYAAEVVFGKLNVSLKGSGVDYHNTVAVNPGENKVYNITLTGVNTASGSLSWLPGVKLPEAGSSMSLAGWVVIGLANILAFASILTVLRRHL